MQTYKIENDYQAEEKLSAEAFEQLIILERMCKMDGCSNEAKPADDFCEICKKGLIEEFKQTNGRDYLESVYFVLGVGTEKVKIGYSQNVNARLDALQTGSPVKLLIIGSFPGTVEDEGKLHKHLEKYRSHGEWFYMVDEIIDIIETINKKGKKGIIDILTDRNK